MSNTVFDRVARDYEKIHNRSLPPGVSSDEFVRQKAEHVIGWILGSRAARDAFAVELRKREEHEARRRQNLLDARPDLFDLDREEQVGAEELGVADHPRGLRAGPRLEARLEEEILRAEDMR